MEIETEIGKDYINLFIPATNMGKFRFKKRKNNLDFGEIFSCRTEQFDNSSYLEWQIGYDALVSDINKETKKTDLAQPQYKFTGANGKDKYPYELSEIFSEAKVIQLISQSVQSSLITEIENYKNFIDEKPISVEHHSSSTINGIKFEEASIKLPTFFLINSDNTQIEVSIQKQQYASGVQPMVYFCIPINAFNNHKNLLNKSSCPTDKLIYTINNNNISNILNLFKVFGMASERHKFDILAILNVL